MKAVIEFYQELDPLNTIIFWGIIIVILLLLVFTILMIGKRKKIKQKRNNQVEKNEIFSDEIALPSNSRDTLIMKDENLLIQSEEKENFEPFILPKTETTNETLEVEKNFKAEEYVMEYNNELFNLSNVKKNSEIIQEESHLAPEKPAFSMPTKPYERNVLREMSLSQTSPIGIVHKQDTLNKSTNKASIPSAISSPQENIKVVEPTIEVNTSTVVTNQSNRTIQSAEIEKKIPHEQTHTTISYNHNISVKPNNLESTFEPKQVTRPVQEISQKTILDNHQEQVVKPNSSEQVFTSSEKLNSIVQKPIVPKNEPLISAKHNQELSSSNTSYLAEVSKKLAEAEIPDEIDRTAYELQQEEDAIISYKELMEKKDTIKTIDEEDAVISITELTTRKNNQDKLYNLTDDKENDEFIDELKKFRNDLQ